ncbi:amino acid permease-domain-containing protein [Mycena capillaripes]|nr:amino acid permease-domain-containing protein [Mycena capillaripes]
MASEKPVANESHSGSFDAQTSDAVTSEKPAAKTRSGSFDVESGSPLESEVGEHKLVRQLKNRHIAMISIGGVIGTGLFLSTANSLRFGGPVGILLGYLVVGSITYSVMISLGEMVAYLPIPGGHIKLAERFVDPAFSFTMGWNYWYNWTIVLPAELSAASVLINYWNKSVNNAAWITIIMVVVIGINMCGAGVYGEAEFIFASIKVITITGLIILGIVLDLGGGPDHDRIGFRYWKNPGPFVQYNNIPGVKGRFLGWWAVMTQAAFSYIGTEIVAIAAGEAKNPRRNLPKAIKRVYIRILLFYIGGVIIIGLLVPSNDDGLNLSSGTAGTAASSPFVIAIQRSGIKTLPSIINACLLTSAWSAGSSDLYTSSRALYGLAAAGNAPRIFLKALPNGLPIASLAFCSAFALLAYMGVTSGSNEVFIWFSNMTSVAGLMTWFGICLTYLRFYAGMKAQGYDRKQLPFASSLQPFAAWYAMFFCLLICFFSGWAVFLDGKWVPATFVTNYLPFILFPILYAGAKFYYWRTGKGFAWKRPEDLDYVTDIAEIEADSYDDPPPKNRIEAFWAWLVSTQEFPCVASFSTVIDVIPT